MKAWTNDKGEWLMISERTTHTGHKVSIEVTENINHAYTARMLMPAIQRKVSAEYPDFAPVEVERLVVMITEDHSADLVVNK